MLVVPVVVVESSQDEHLQRRDFQMMVAGHIDHSHDLSVSVDCWGVLLRDVLIGVVLI